MLRITPNISIPLSELDFTAIRSQGPGGQNVNKVASAVQLRFDVPASSLPASAKTRLMAFRDRRISSVGVVVIKAQSHRQQHLNRQDAIERFEVLLRDALKRRKIRRATRPTRASKERRLVGKSRRGQVKSMRSRVRDTD